MRETIDLSGFGARIWYKTRDGDSPSMTTKAND
jgi:hypothetical protein